MWEALFKFAPPLIQAVSVAVTAVFAVIGLRAWRRQLLGRRKIEIAEGTLLATYKIQEAMAYIRNPGALVGGSTRERQPDESDSVARLRDTYFVPLERMQKTSGDFAEFEKMQLLCQVYFDHEAGQSFERVKKARHTVSVAARMLLQTAGEHGMDSASNRKLVAKWCSHIWEGYGVEGAQPDELTEMVSRAVADIEAMCRPHLRL
jgi:hypothetical protein